MFKNTHRGTYIQKKCNKPFDSGIEIIGKKLKQSSYVPNLG